MARPSGEGPEHDPVALTASPATTDAMRRVAHDLGNVLARVSGYTELARRKLEPDHPAEAELAQVQAAAGEGARLARELAELADTAGS